MAWTNSIGLTSLKGCVFLHLTVLVIMSSSTHASRPRLKLDQTKLAEYAKRNHNRVMSLLANGPSIKRRRHLHYVHNYDTPSVRIEGYMFCRTGFLLEIGRDGRITGTTNMTSPNALLEIQVFGKTERRVKAVASGRYLSMNNGWRLTSTTLSRSTRTLLKEKLEENTWYSYRSIDLGENCRAKRANKRRKNRHKTEWFIAIKENGYLRRPCKTLPGMKATHFYVLTPEQMKQILGDTDTSELSR